MKLEIKDLHYSYSGTREQALQGISLKFDSEGKGLFLGIGGPNGSGKSTLLKVMAGVLPQSSGEILWEGKNLAQLPKSELSSLLAFIPTLLNFEFGILAKDFVLQGRFPHLKGFSSPSKEDEKIVAETMEMVGVEKLQRRDVREVSTGERQLLSLARALTQRPKVLLLDEALANLDLAYQRRILQILRDLIHCEVSVVLVTHDLGLLGEFAPEILWLQGGKVFVQGKAESVFTTDVISSLYGVKDQVEVQVNPLTNRPHIFWK